MACPCLACSPADTQLVPRGPFHPGDEPCGVIPAAAVLPADCAHSHRPRFSTQVRKRYLALVLRLHPDKVAHPQAAEAFAAVEAAVRMLNG